VDFLRAQFHQELDDEGEIIIAGETFARHDILNGLAPEPYRVAFNEWIENRRIRLLDKAAEILSHFDNAGRFEQVGSTFNKGAMIPFVGAGLSVPSGFPSWTKFLFQLCDESHVSPADLKSLLDDGLYEEGAQLLYDDMGSAVFNEAVQSTFGSAKLPLGPINLLPALFPDTSVLTTNFDILIETIYKGDGCRIFDIVQSGKVLSEVCRQMASGDRLLVKIHGDCRQVADRVLLKSEYNAAYADAGAVELFFNQVMFGRSILFLGCSLCTDRTLKTMKALVTKFGPDNLPRHYAFLELKTGDDRAARRKFLAGANIFPIWYDEGDHDEAIEALFLKLLSIR
jgi:SIR2-like protein